MTLFYIGDFEILSRKQMVPATADDIADFEGVQRIAPVNFSPLFASQSLPPVKGDEPLNYDDKVTTNAVDEVIFLETFEGGDSAFTTSVAQFTDGSGDFFTQTDGTTIGSFYEVTGQGGSFYFAAMDLDGEVASATQTMTFTGIDITGFENLSFSGLFAEDDDGANQDWDADTLVFVEAQIDGGGFTKILQFASQGATNTEPGLDTDFDGIADSTALTSVFASFSGAIAGTGSSLDIRITFDNLNAGDEDISIDNVQITGDSIVTPFDLQVTEMWPGQDGTDITEDWFEITNNGGTAWTAATDGSLYYDDDSQDATAADLVNGISSIAAGEVVIVVIGVEQDAIGFRNVWEPVIDLTSVQIGWTDGSGLGSGGDGVTLFVDDETDGVDAGDQVEFESYPDASANSGQSWDVVNAGFSVTGQNGAVETVATGGTSGLEPAVGSPGNGAALNNAILSIAATDAAIDEGDSGTTSFTFTVSRSGNTSGAVSVDYAVTSASAVAADFGGSLPTGTVNFADGETSQVITIDVSGDTDVEMDEDFTVTLSNASAGAVINTASADSTIQNDDAAAAAMVLINEFQSNPPGTDPANQTFELKGEAGASFSGWLVSIESDGPNGLVDRATQVSGTFDSDGLLTVDAPDLENPSFTLVLTDSFTGTVGSTDVDSDDDGTADDFSAFGTIFDAIGIADSTGDETALYGSDFGGTDLTSINFEPEIVFRDGTTGALFQVGDIDGSGDQLFDADGNVVDPADFDTDPTLGTTFGAVNPTSQVTPVILINEFQPNPDGSDPAMVTFELKGSAGTSFDGWIVSLESDGANGLVDRASQVSGTFDANGLLTVSIDDLENPSFTVVLTDDFTGTVGVTDVDSDDDGTADDFSAFGTIFDAIGIPDSAADEASLYGTDFGGADFAFTGAEPELVFRDGATNDLYAVNVAGAAGGSVFDVNGNDVGFVNFDTDPTAAVDSFGAVNPIFGAAPDPTDPANVLRTKILGSITLGGSEINAFDPDTDKAFVTSSAGVQIIDASIPQTPVLLRTIDPTVDGATTSDTTSVAVANGIVAISVPDATITNNGSVFFYDTDGVFLGSVAVGPLPDMLTFNEDGTKLLVANEAQSAGEENEADILPNPNGSVSIIDINTMNLSNSVVNTFDFSDASITFASLLAKGVRTDESSPSAAADLEPEFITIEGNTAFITLQENNAVAVIDDISSFTGFTIDDILPLGTQDHSVVPLDPSNRDDGINIETYDIVGLRMPDAIASYTVEGVTYFVTANEGDGRDVDETRGADLVDGDLSNGEIDTTEVSMTLQNQLADDALLGRLKFSNIDGDIDGDGLIEELHSFGSRSFSIFDENGNLIYDSEALFEQITANQVPGIFNSDESDPSEFDDRSDDKGPEPEAVALGEIDSQTYAFIGLERVGGVMVFDVTDPNNPVFDQYIVLPDDFGPEGLTFIAPENSPTGAALLAVSSEDSDTLTFIEFNGATRIGDVQGNADNQIANEGLIDASPLLGETVTISGVVVGDYQTGNGSDGDLGGFYIQDPFGDGDVTTSDGIFIFTGDTPLVDVSLGDTVTVTGVVEEFFGQTQIDMEGLSFTIEDTGFDISTMITTIDFTTVGTTADDDGELIADLEAYEGMLVDFAQTITLTSNFNLDRFGEVTGSAAGRLVQYTQENAPDLAGNQAYLDFTASQTFTIDDGFNGQNNPIDRPDGMFGEDDDFRLGDTSTDLFGVLGYGFDDYRLRPVDLDANGNPYDDITFDNTNPRPDTAPDIGGSIQVASLNVLNFFTTLDDGSFTANGNEPRGANDQTEFDRQLDKLVDNILGTGAEVIGLQEIENDFDGLLNGGKTDAIQVLVDALNAELGETVWDFVNPGVDFVGDDAIATAFIYDTTMVQVGEGTSPAILDDSVLATLPGFETAPATFDGVNTNRAVLAVTFEEIASGELFTAINNHYKSKGGTGSGGDADIGDGQSDFNETRLRASQAILAWLETNPTGTDDPDTLILGDLNSYAKEDPIAALEAAGFTNLIDAADADAYNYNFGGFTGTLDYLLGSETLVDQMTGAAPWLINSDEPDALDYNLDFGRDPSLFNGDTPTRASDHDPIIVGLNLAPTNETIIGGDGDDVLTGRSGDDLVMGGAGNDTVQGGAGNDTVIGQAGDDLASGNSGDDLVTGGAGNDTLVGGTGLDFLSGGEGDDELFGGEGDDTADGGLDDDLIAGFDGNDLLTGASGIDTLNGGTGDDTLSGGSGDDQLFGFDGNDNVHGGLGDDLVDGGADNDVVTGNEGRDTILGRTGNDMLFGGLGTDLINGREDNDTVSGGLSDDTVMGGIGNDFVNGGNGNDSVLGDHGNDFVTGGRGNDQVYGGQGVDTVIGGFGNDTVLGQSGDDEVFGGSGNDQAFGGDGSDTVTGNAGDDEVTGDQGDDELFGGIGNDTVDGGADNDMISAGAGQDLIIGGFGNDTAFGGTGQDTMAGGNGNDSLFGNQQADQLFGGEGNDFLSGGADNDLLAGNADDDFLSGGAGNDTVFGGTGLDDITGGTGDDLLFGNQGADTLSGGAGNDTLTGGNDADTYLFAGDIDVNVVTSFTAGVGADDVLDISGYGTDLDEFSEIIAASSDNGTDTTIDLGNGNLIILEGVLVTDLVEDDFMIS